MQNMERTFAVLFVIFILIWPIKGNETINFQKNQLSENKDTIDLLSTYYWYYLQIEFKTDKESNHEIINISFPKKNMKSGIYDSFAKDSWRCLQFGKQLINGPFKSQEEAQNSLLYYKVASRHSDSVTDLSNEELYWFNLMVNPKYGKTRLADKFISDFVLNKGTKKQFIQDVKSSLQNRIFTQGPFKDCQFANEILKFNFYRAGKATIK
jgi:hypothetical protein